MKVYFSEASPSGFLPLFEGVSAVCRAGSLCTAVAAGFGESAMTAGLSAAGAGAGSSARYSLRNMSTNSRNSDTSSGPKMMPMNPNSDRPTITPKIVISGWVSAIFFWRMKRSRLSLCEMNMAPNARRPIAVPHCPSTMK